MGNSMYQFLNINMEIIMSFFFSENAVSGKIESSLSAEHCPIAADVITIYSPW